MSREFRQQPVEFRYDGNTLDEVVAKDADVHLEQMDVDHYALIIETRTHRACVFIGAKNGRSHVKASVSWHDPVNRRSEAQRRRWNALTPAQRKRRKR